MRTWMPKHDSSENPRQTSLFFHDRSRLLQRRNGQVRHGVFEFLLWPMLAIVIGLAGPALHEHTRARAPEIQVIRGIQ